ncbi:hypothetical protein R3P38DRAFT_2413447, partial [Favolaschia claudopus]
FNAVTTVHFTDGQSFSDILKCVLPCIAQLFPPNDPLVHCIRCLRSRQSHRSTAKTSISSDNTLGTTNHGSTRPGEGFQQEAREAYAQTNGKDMNHMDEVQEAVARIRMEIDAHD